MKLVRFKTNFKYRKNSNNNIKQIKLIFCLVNQRIGCDSVYLYKRRFLDE